jgi:protease I
MKKQKQKRALIITGEYVTDVEFTYPYYRLLEEEFIVDVATQKQQDVKGKFGTKIKATKDTRSVWAENYDVLILPGGATSMEYLRQDSDIIECIMKFNELGKVIASICHGSQLLISARLTAGRRVSGYYSIKDDINNSGGIFTDEPSVVDGNLITTAHYKHLGAWMKTVLEILRRRGVK